MPNAAGDVGGAESATSDDANRDFRDFFENASVPFHWVDADGVILRANQAELDFLGYDANEYIGHNIREFYVNSDDLEAVMRRLAAREAVHEFDAELRARDGSVRRVAIDSSAMWHDGQFMHTRCLMRDLSYRQMADDIAIRMSAIVDSSDDAIISKDLDGVVRSWNSSAERIFGYTEDEMIGRSIRTIIPADHQYEEDEVLARIRAGERVAHFETIRQRKDGSMVPISLTVSPVRDGSGRVVGASKIARDISERIAADEALRESIAMKDQFLSLVSHELRTPIATIVGNSQLLLRRGERLPAHARAQALEDVVGESERLQHIVENLLILTRLNAKQELMLTPIDLSELVGRAVDAASRRELDRSIRLQADDILHVIGDATLLTMVVQNLITNAVKYSTADTAIEVVLQRSLAGRAEVHILDSGIGIDVDDSERIFDAFFRAASATTGATGMGLGLAVSRKAIEAQGGTLRMEPRSGGGSDFCFSLPLLNGPPS